LSFQQASNESISEAWERLHEYILVFPHHGLDNWLILQNFYNGLSQSSHDHVDAAASRAFFSLTIERAAALIEKMVSNQGWSDDCLQPCKIDLLLKMFEDYSQDKGLNADTLSLGSSHDMRGFWECWPFG